MSWRVCRWLSVRERVRWREGESEEEGIIVAESTADRGATVSLDVTSHTLDEEHVTGTLDAGESLSVTEIASLYESGDLGREELAASFEARDNDGEFDDGRVQSTVTDD